MADDETPVEKENAVANDAPGQQSLAHIFGEISWMLTRSTGHRHLFIGDLEWLILAPVTRSQFRLYRDEEQKPVGLILWAYLTEESEKLIEAGNSRLRPQDWNNGDRLWIIEVIDLAGNRVEAMLNDLKQNVFPDTPIKLIRVTNEGKRETTTLD